MGITEIATIASPIISAIAIIVALCISSKSSKDAQQQINAIHHLLDVFIAAHNLDIAEAKRKCKQQLEEINQKINEAKVMVDIAISPFPGGTPIDKLLEKQEYLKRLDILKQLQAERTEIETNLSLIQDYLNKAKQK